jgi:amidohydrolase
MFDIKWAVKDILPQVVKWRRHIHQNPELAFNEYKTAALVEQALQEAGVDYVRHKDSTAVVGTIVGGLPGKTIALRADMDALPLDELTEVPFKSETPGIMHACGHDVHTAILMGVATVLSKHRKHIPGTVKLFFQPAEEKPPGGALNMIEQGGMEGVEHVFGLHVGSDLPAGQVSLTRGYSSANSDLANIRIIGKGGHGAHPQSTVDAVMVGAHVVVALQTIVSRNVGPLDSAVISVGSISAGTINNIIAETADLKLTIRSLKPEIRELLKERIEGIVKGITQAMNATYEMDYVYGYPSLPNDEHMVELVKGIAETTVGAENVRVKDVPGMGGEDFAYFAQKVPGAFFSIGSRPAENAFPGHNPKFKVDEECIPVGLEMMINLALQATKL